MAEQTTMDAPATKRAMEDQTYCVMVREEQKAMDEGVVLEHEVEYVWVDVATVTVPARTLRKTVVEKALAQSGYIPKVGETLEVRVLDAQSASPFMVGAEQPAPVLVIGEQG